MDAVGKRSDRERGERRACVGQRSDGPVALPVPPPRRQRSLTGRRECREGYFGNVTCYRLQVTLFEI